jgi:two-component system phosphate regulon response regulator PhoB
MQALIVDDDEFIRLLFCDILKTADFETHAAASASSAIAALKNLTPDIAFIDYNMPGATGLDVIDYIRKTPRLAKTKVVVVTANTQAESIVENRGIDLFLEKPVAPRDVIEFARRLTAQSTPAAK